MKAQEFFKEIVSYLKEKKENAINEAIEDYFQDRISNLKNNATYKDPFKEGPKVVIQLIPLESFENPKEYDLAKYYRDYQAIKPMKFGSMDQAYNYEGLISFEVDYERHCCSYVQVFRNGIIEAVDTHPFRASVKSIYSRDLVNILIEGINQYIEFQIKIGVKLPIIAYLSLLGINEYRIPNVEREDYFDNIHAIEREELFLPKIVITKPTIMYEELRPLMDMIWNACGYPKCQEYDKDGTWIKR